MLEVYNEALRDLLAAGPEAAKLDVSASLNHKPACPACQHA